MDSPPTDRHRRTIRLQGFGYQQPGVYFLTICAFEKKPIFGHMRGDAVELSPIGRVVRECWVQIPRHFRHAELDAFVVMPNHLHGIVLLHRRPGRVAVEAEAFRKPVSGSVPTIVRSFKSAVSARVRDRGLALPHSVWQRNYFERVIRNGREFTQVMRYILENPARWQYDEENPDRS
jgi:REP-associated tyrosine transposase